MCVKSRCALKLRCFNNKNVLKLSVVFREF
nr:MAG TPA: hypothetical protein [Caudoviricetes sp.]